MLIIVLALPFLRSGIKADAILCTLTTLISNSSRNWLSSIVQMPPGFGVCAYGKKYCQRLDNVWKGYHKSWPITYPNIVDEHVKSIVDQFRINQRNSLLDAHRHRDIVTSHRIGTTRPFEAVMRLLKAAEGCPRVVANTFETLV